MTELQDLISVEKLQQQGFSKVREVHIDEGLDSTGDPAYFIWVLMDDAVPDTALKWGVLEPMFNHVRQTAWLFSREKIYPYVRVQKVSEWHAPQTV